MCSGLEAGPDRLLVIGDSLALDVEPYLADELPGWEIETHAAQGKKTPQGLAELDAAGPADVLAISLGTNDDPWEVEAFRSAIRPSSRELHPPAASSGPTSSAPRATGVSYDAFNEALAEAARQDPRLVVADWTGLVGANPSWLDARRDPRDERGLPGARPPRRGRGAITPDLRSSPDRIRTGASRLEKPESLPLDHGAWTS